MFICFVYADTPVHVQPSPNALESTTKGTTCTCQLFKYVNTIFPQ